MAITTDQKRFALFEVDEEEFLLLTEAFMLAPIKNLIKGGVKTSMTVTRYYTHEEIRAFGSRLQAMSNRLISTRGV